MHERYGREDRIRAGRDIRATFREGTRRSGRFCDVIVRASPVGQPRFGTVVPKHGRSSVERNLVKRRLREIGRRAVLPQLRDGVGMDVLVRAKPASYDAGFAALRSDVLETLRRALR